MKKRPLTEEAKTEAIFQKYEFLNGFIHPRNVERSVVLLAGADLLNLDNQAQPIHVNDRPCNLFPKIFFLDMDGDKVLQVGFRVNESYQADYERYVSRKFWHPKRWLAPPTRGEEFFEDIRSALERARIYRDVHYILYLAKIHSRYEFYEFFTARVMLYVAPEGMNIRQSIEESIKAARAEIEETLSAS